MRWVRVRRPHRQIVALLLLSLCGSGCHILVLIASRVRTSLGGRGCVIVLVVLVLWRWNEATGNSDGASERCSHAVCVCMVRACGGMQRG